MWRGAVLAGVVEDENVNDPQRGFVGGYHLELAMLDLPTLPLIGLPYGWGRDFASIIDNYGNMAGMFINGEDLSRSDNRITLSTTLKDPYGNPVAHVHCDEHPNDVAMRKHAQQQGKRIYEAVGAKRVVFSGTPARHAPNGHGAHERDPAPRRDQLLRAHARDAEPVHFRR